jgi:hypothetical protein
MVFIPDVIVTTDYSPATIALVGEAKGAAASLEKVELPLKQYMLRMGCSIGIIFTPQVLRIYKDRFSGRTQDSIELVGEFPSDELFNARQPIAGGSDSEVESALVDWLDELARTGKVAVRDLRLRSAIAEHVLPAISGGRVSRIHPGTPEG